MQQEEIRFVLCMTKSIHLYVYHLYVAAITVCHPIRVTVKTVKTVIRCQSSHRYHYVFTIPFNRLDIVTERAEDQKICESNPDHELNFDSREPPNGFILVTIHPALMGS